MDLNYYFEPVCLDRPEGATEHNDSVFGRNIQIHTASNPIDEISNYQIAILGVEEDRNSPNKGTSLAPDQIRQKLYELYKVNDKLKIIDLGNLKKTDRPENTYFGLRDVMIDLLNNQVTAIILGGSQDLTQAVFKAYEQRFSKVNLVSIDSRIDLNEGEPGSFSWSKPLINHQKLFRFTHMGCQQYLIDPAFIKNLEEKGFDVLRLGILRSNIARAEPFLRDAHMVSLDISSIKQSEAPGTKFATPNGFLAEEACQLTRFAGLSDLVSCLGIFEVNESYDHNNQTAHLAAQAIWYFMEGFSQRRKEKPSQNNSDFKIFLVNHRDMEHALTFYKSLVTGRWWMEIPDMKNDGQILVSCSPEEYQQACNHDIPDMWWKAFQRIN